jgi:hypothetical protein
LCAGIEIDLEKTAAMEFGISADRVDTQDTDNFFHVNHSSGELDSMIVSLHATPPAIMRQQGTLGPQRAQPEAIEAGAAGSGIGCKAGVGCIALDPHGLLAADDAVTVRAGYCGVIFRKTVREGNSQPDRWRRFRRQGSSMCQKNHAT